MAIKFTNNATATLAASISTSSTSLTVTTSQGALFPTLGAGEYFYATLTDSSNNLEIVKITARSSDTLTAVRAQEGTTARIYAAADKLELRVTAATLTNFATQDGVNTFTAANTFSSTSSFTGASNFTGAVTFSNVPSFSGGALPIANGGTGVSTTSALALLVGNIIFPVGSLYSSTSATNPGTSLGFGTWAQFGAGRMMMGAGGAFGAGTTGGSNDSTLPTHTHTYSSTTSAVDLSHTHSYNLGAITGGGVYAQVTQTNAGAVNTSGASVNMNHSHSVSGTTASAGASPTNTNLPPYVVVYMWQRTA
jgi:hypothetical protein